jgi:hypothetical protein
LAWACRKCPVARERVGRLWGVTPKKSAGLRVPCRQA